MAKATEPSQRQKQRTDDDDDRISNLPDVLLIQILCLLSTKQAILTSILSHRWRPVWTSLPFLDFDDETSFDEAESSAPYGGWVDPSTHYRSGFKDFVNSILLQHEAPFIKRFTLRCANPNCTNGDVANWVSHVARRKVEHVEINLSISRYVVLPRRLFNCNTISVLKLNGVFLNVLGSFSVRLPLVKVLHIGNRVLYGCHAYIVKLLAGCPLLEDLVLESIYNDACGGFDCEIKNFGVNLSNLKRARIGFSWKERCRKSMLLLFQALCHVHWLSLSSSTYACMLSATENDIPVFNNLTQLEISSEDYSWNFLMNLLKCSPKVEAITIHKESLKFGREPGPRWKRPVSVPKCLLLNLKTLCLKEFHGTPTELDFVEFFMQHGGVLERLEIYVSSSLISEAKLRIHSHLSGLHRKFGTSQLVISLNPVS